MLSDRTLGLADWPISFEGPKPKKKRQSRPSVKEVKQKTKVTQFNHLSKFDELFVHQCFSS